MLGNKFRQHLEFRDETGLDTVVYRSSGPVTKEELLRVINLSNVRQEPLVIGHYEKDASYFINVELGEKGYTFKVLYEEVLQSFTSLVDVLTFVNKSILFQEKDSLVMQVLGGKVSNKTRFSYTNIFK